MRERLIIVLFVVDHGGFKLDWWHHAKTGMQALAVVDDFDPVGHDLL